MTSPRLRHVMRGTVTPLLLTSVVIMLLGDGMDARIADWLYDWQGHAWRFRHDDFVALWLHHRAQRFNYLIYFATLVLTAAACLPTRLRPWRRPLLYVVLASTTCLVLVSLGKALVPIPCPWDLQRYGGHLPDGGLLQWQSAGRFKGCFPAGHATGGFSLFAWYFFAQRMAWPAAHRVLVAALVGGFALGIVQQLRGAHFLSHDLAAAILCWVVARSLADWMLPEPHHAPSSPPMTKGVLSP